MFSYVYLFTSFWLVTGAYIDGWAHNHVPELETFFTPWHAVLYSGYLAMVLTLLLWIWLRKRKGHSWREAVPEGHGLSLLGAGVFFFGGIGDMLWHIAFGIEAGIEALLSPTHLLLATGAFLLFSGGARHVLRGNCFLCHGEELLERSGKSHESMCKKQLHLRMTQMMYILSVTFCMMILTYMTQFARYTQIL
ncbi:hypothetical protein COW95_03595 [Candidatus Peregrinibacteria bacterium CG22_combo_CG10-13_8_21_14_all_49_11]|nr:MAG: hypothetical protein COW95_03595 [Candidatus Peregrinibacteria bacterium CG22_combo_CG10-13_8_21_14_all_49_11]